MAPVSTEGDGAAGVAEVGVTPVAGAVGPGGAVERPPQATSSNTIARAAAKRAAEEVLECLMATPANQGCPRIRVTRSTSVETVSLVSLAHSRSPSVNKGGLTLVAGRPNLGSSLDQVYGRPHRGSSSSEENRRST